MPCVVTSIHDPIALDATCQRLGLGPTEEDSVWLGDFEVVGRAVRLAGLHAPLVCDTLTGLVAYHPRDNGFYRYARIMHFIHRYYDIRARLRMSSSEPSRQRRRLRARRRLLAADVA